MSSIDEIREGHNVNLENYPNISPSQLNLLNFVNFQLLNEQYKLE